MGVAGYRRMVLSRPERKEGEHDHDVATDATAFYIGMVGGFPCFSRCALGIDAMAHDRRLAPRRLAALRVR